MPIRSNRGTTPGGKGRFPGYDVLDEVPRWDEVTAGVVLARLDPFPDHSFFTPEEFATLKALLDVLLGQKEEPRVPVARMVDQRLALGETDGWFYEDMPPDGPAWRRTLGFVDLDARTRFGRGFSELEWSRQVELVQAVQDAEDYHGLPAGHVWSLWTRYACAAFYSHPWAWNEIGFGGPAYPRGYKAIGVDQRERWERPEVDARDPVPWAHRVEEARRAHEHDGSGGG
jgi:hypothetical protein